MFHERTKHIEIDLHFVRDIIQAGTVVTSHIASSQQPADIFTKALGKLQFQHLMSKLGILDPHAPTWGGVLGDIIILEDIIVHILDIFHIYNYLIL